MADENRVHPRLVVRLPAEFRTPESTAWEPATVHDLSASGAVLIAARRLVPEGLVTLRFTLPEDEGKGTLVLEIESLVLRSEPLSAVGGNVQYRAALHFLGLHGESFERVRRYIFRRTRGV